VDGGGQLNCVGYWIEPTIEEELAATRGKRNLGQTELVGVVSKPLFDAELDSGAAGHVPAA
jgi:hypothetical protein